MATGKGSGNAPRRQSEGAQKHLYLQIPQEAPFLMPLLLFPTSPGTLAVFRAQPWALASSPLPGPSRRHRASYPLCPPPQPRATGPSQLFPAPRPGAPSPSPPLRVSRGHFLPSSQVKFLTTLSFHFQVLATLPACSAPRSRRRGRRPRFAAAEGVLVLGLPKPEMCNSAFRAGFPRILPINSSPGFKTKLSAIFPAKSSWLFTELGKKSQTASLLTFPLLQAQPSTRRSSNFPCSHTFL